jgi:hypothetical protein
VGRRGGRPRFVSGLARHVECKGRSRPSGRGLASPAKNLDSGEQDSSSHCSNQVRTDCRPRAWTALEASVRQANVAKALSEFEPEPLLQELATAVVADCAMQRVGPPAEGQISGQLQTIHHHGNRSYSLGNWAPIIVTAEEHSALRAFAEHRAALNTKALEGYVSNVSRIMGQLVRKFPGAVRRPVRKGDGYYIEVKAAPEK